MASQVAERINKPVRQGHAVNCTSLKQFAQFVLSSSSFNKPLKTEINVISKSISIKGQIMKKHCHFSVAPVFQQSR